jgi:histidine triad (HIT) family protein
MDKCLFCSIVTREVPAQLIYEDDQAVAFKDIDPKAPTHVLIVPRKHIAGLSAASDEDGAVLGHLQLVARKIAEKGGISDGFRVVVNNGKGAGQTVFHIHYHLLGGRKLTWPPG